MKRAMKLAVAVALSTAAAFSVAEAKPKCPEGIFCPTYYDPVICDNGQVYSNSCFASAACARNCVPYVPAA
jgi:hypothetical protein